MVRRKVVKVAAKKKAGRPGGASYNAAQLGIIAQARKEGLGWRRIPKKYPGFGLKAEGVKEVLRKMKKQGGSVVRVAGSGRYFLFRGWRRGGFELLALT